MIYARPRLHAHRVRWRIAVARLAASAQTARVAMGDATCTDAAIAKRWALRSDRSVARFFDPESGKALAFGDVLALPPELARDILTRALAALDESNGPIPSAEETLGDITIALGEIAAVIKRDRVGGKVNNHRLHADHFARAMAIAMRGHLAAIRKAEATEGGR